MAAGIVAGVALGQVFPGVPETLSRFEYASVSIPVAVLIWAMIFPMMLQIDFGAVMAVRREPTGLVVTSGVNWLLKPFSMFAISWFFLLVVFAPFIDEALGLEYLAGTILLGAARTARAMVFVWSYLTRGDAAYTLVQVAINDSHHAGGLRPHRDAAAGHFEHQRAVEHHVVVGGAVHRDPAGRRVRHPHPAHQASGSGVVRRGVPSPTSVRVTPAALIVTLVVLFAFQGDVIPRQARSTSRSSPYPVVIQTFFIFFVAYCIFRRLGIRVTPSRRPVHSSVPATSSSWPWPAAIALFGLQSRGGAGRGGGGAGGSADPMLACCAVFRERHRRPTRFPGDASRWQRQGVVT